MNRKWVGVALAVALAAVGTWVIVSFVRGAENRALEGQETVAVLVVDSEIPAGTAAEDISGQVHVELVPSNVQAHGSLEDIAALKTLEGLVASVDLLPGEQVIVGRFVATEVLDDQDQIEIADDMIEVTLSLSPERAIGGRVRPGDEVSVLASFEAQSGASPLADDTAGSTAGTTSDAPSTTHIILGSVVVTSVQVEELPRRNTSEESGTASLELAPTGQLLVTLATEPANAERLIFTAEFGRVWLADASQLSAVADTNIQDRSTVYDDPAPGR